MRAYHYDPTTGVYNGRSSEADESPLEPGVFLIPAYATEQEPPGELPGQQAVFLGDMWQLEDIPAPPPRTNENITSAPDGLFGGPTLAKVLGE